MRWGRLPRHTRQESVLLTNHLLSPPILDTRTYTPSATTASSKKTREKTMEKFITHTGIGVPLRRSNVDTDQIIPAVYLKRVTKS